MQWELIGRVNVTLYTLKKYYSGYSLVNQFLQEKSEKVLEGVWKRSDADVHWSHGGDREEEAHVSQFK